VTDDDDYVDNDGELQYILLHMYARRLTDSHVEFYHSSQFTLRIHRNLFNALSDLQFIIPFPI
jgi:hypothetical protein